MSLTGRGIFVPRRLSPPLAVRGLDYTLAVGACRRPLPSSLYTFMFFNRDSRVGHDFSGPTLGSSLAREMNCVHPHNLPEG